MNVRAFFRIGTARRLVQAICLALFCLLLGAAQQGELFSLPADLFLRLDPLVGTAVPIAARTVIWSLIPSLVVILLALLAGRLFCGWICPMGTTLDVTGALTGWKRTKHTKDPVPRYLKYIILAVVLTAALFGVNLAFWASPIPLATRLYTLVLHPLALLGLDHALAASAPLADRFGISEWQYWYPELRSYQTAWFVALFWLGLMLLERVRPRFWCRYLCPAGALLGLFSLRAPWRRRATPSCNTCGRCAARCAAGTLHANPSVTKTSECLICGACKDHCTSKAIRFGFVQQTGIVSEPKTDLHFLPARRAVCGSLAAGALLAGVNQLEAVGRMGGHNPHGNLVRPPGSLPESDFLARCVRCGECMKACPTGGLQPTWLQAGFSGIFSPFLDPRSGPCVTECVACGNVCPSRAIQALPLHEKRWAKIGTAVVDKTLCLAWAEDKRCMVCQETCPYGAVSIVPQAGHSAPVPVVRQERCYGCGFCEKHCPTARASIIVKSFGALRQHTPAFETMARVQGLELDPSEHKVDHPEYDPLSKGAPPGFLN